jgi:L-lactate dehydrogenase (cytochrome)
MYGVAALGPLGADHVINILKAEMVTDMHQLGIERMDQLSDCRHPS